MPFNTSAPRTCETTLPCQSDAPESDRIVFTARIFSCEEMKGYRSRLADLFKLEDDAQSAAANSLIKEAATGWSNIVDDKGEPLPFDDAPLDKLDLQTKMRIASQLPDAAGWGQLTKKA
jgi:hypothetical protein